MGEVGHENRFCVASTSPLGASIEVQNALLVQELLSLEADVHVCAKDGTEDLYEYMKPMELCLQYGNKHVETLLDAFDGDDEEEEEEEEEEGAPPKPPKEETPARPLDDRDPDMKI